MSQTDIERGGEVEAVLRTIFDTVDESLLLLSPDGTIIDLNEVAARRMGRSRDELLGRDAFEALSPDVRARRLAVFERVVARDKEASLEDERDGLRIMSRLHRVEDSTGRLVSVVVYGRDVTGRWQIEDALRKNRETLHLILDTVPQSIFWKDTEGRYLGCNRVFAATVGLDSPREIVGKTDFDLPWPRAEAEAYRGDDRDVVATNRAKLHIIEQIQTVDGHRIWADTSKLPLRDRDGRPFGVLGVYEDITERRAAEQDLRRTKETLEVAQEGAGTGAWDWDLQSGEIVWSREMFDLLGLDSRTQDASFASWESAVHPEDREPAKQRIEDALRGHRYLENEYRVVTANGEIRWISALGKGFYDEAGQPARMTGICMDITRRKMAEDERARLEARLLQAEKMDSVGRLAGGVAHDFNNMLGVILGHCEMAMEQLSREHPAREDLGEIRRAAEHSADLTRQLLAFARKQTVTPRVLDLNATIDGTLKMLTRLIGEGITLSWQPGVALWPVNVDPSQLDQVLANLCVNARDAISGVGSITISTRNTTVVLGSGIVPEGTVPGPYVCLTVTDDGCGMGQETLSHLFEPFFTTKGLGKGTGLGLATVYGIVSQNKGFINVLSEPGQGTTISIFIPRHQGESDSLQASGAPDAAVHGDETILLVEDEPAILKMTRTILSRYGYAVLTARTPGEAMGLAREHAGPIHLLLTDVVMPEMNGPDLARKILTLHPHIRHLFMSGYTADVMAHEGVLDEAVMFVQKPFSAAALARKVRAALDRR